ncbi:lipocalin/fatty acid-binding family protein [Limosilactobacillus reuteri]|uniref:lipocalin/fatty acid-binding family protein n=1 Tax=Limosilactobacillus reuteri TaxID=1598 RepID=UPI001E381A37|nr:lipocalin/fatty acid-binding family protein [Limosilactobacillus reuteri]MCC4367783.1 lipocalin/fatty acid-binding family protein [Limosilactobacillus reuteri]
MMVRNPKKKRYHIGLITFTILLVILLGILGVNYKQFASKQLNPVRDNNVVKKSSPQITKTVKVVGSYRDDQDGAAIVLNENGTGRYVYADKNNPDTDDSLTWRKDGERYLINLEDRDVTNPLTAALDNNKLVITGSNGWNTETLQKVNEELNLQQFLNDMHKK